MTMIPKNKITWGWIALAAILAVLSVFIFSIAPANRRVVLTLAVMLLFVFAIVWYVPHMYRERQCEPSYLPAVYFVIGTVLIVLGCMSSAFLSAEVGEQGQWGHIAEVVPLVLGAVVGGTYCCDAILGQDFDDGSFQLGPWGAVAGAAPIFFLLCVSCLPPYEFWTIIAILCASFSPALAIAIMKKTAENRLSQDAAFYIFLMGAFLIFVAGVTAIWILPAAMNYQPRLPFFEKAQIVNIVKNLVPSYCGAIGAGLITRSMERNFTTFSFEDWINRYFDMFDLVSVATDGAQLTWKNKEFRPGQTIVMTLDPTVLEAMTSGSRKRAPYGKKLSKWLSEEAKQKSHKNKNVLELTTSKAENLDRRK